MYLSTLIDGIVGLPPGRTADVPVRGLAVDSRYVEPGYVFFARPGLQTHGARYIEGAIESGAAAVFVPRGVEPVHPDAIEVDDLPAVVGRMADRFFGTPSAALDVVGVTGSNGKSTVTHVVATALGAVEGEGACGMSGTLGYGVPGHLRGTELTTPDVLDTHRILADLRAAGARRAAMEVSSHGIEQGRVAGVRFHTACLTNFSRDHLDYHGSTAAYAAAKRRLFTWPGLDAAVLNADDCLGRAILESDGIAARRLSYGLDNRRAAVRGHITGGDAGSLCLEVRYGGRRTVLESPLGGRFNAYNLLAGLAILIALEIPLEMAADGIAAARAPRGRMERVRIDDPGKSLPRVFVDYAHTPDALDAALGALKEHRGGEIWVVFGCGGNRDSGKRPLMGAAAARGASRLVVTSDNPRNEDPMAIIRDILAGTRSASVEVEPDRRTAIHSAISNADPGDIVLVAGKGHETWQELAGERLPFDDAAVVREALAARIGRSAP